MSAFSQRKRILGSHYGTRNRGRYSSNIDGRISYRGECGNVLPIQQDDNETDGSTNHDEHYPTGYKARDSGERR